MFSSRHNEAQASALRIVSFLGFAMLGCSGDDSGAELSNDELDLETIYARAAVVIGSCLPGYQINRSLADLWFPEETPRLAGSFVEQVECLARHGNGCEAAEECLGWSVSEEPGSCETTCRGDVFEGCRDGLHVRMDCNKVGLLCDPHLICSRAPSSPCDEALFARKCIANGKPQLCHDAAIVNGPDCAALGLECDAGYCRGAGETCPFEHPDDQGQVRYLGILCLAATLDSCVQGTRHQIRCTDKHASFDCHGRENAVFCGLGSECVPGEEPGRDPSGSPLFCSGSSVVVCNAGRQDRVDCRRLGFSDCDVEASGGCVP